MSLSNANLIALTDKLAAYYLAGLGTSGSGFGAGDGNATLASDWGMSRKARDLQVLVLGTADADVVTSLLATSTDLVTRSKVSTLMQGMVYGFMGNLARACAASGLVGVSNLDTFATYFNTSVAGPYACLLHPQFGELFFIMNSARLSPANVFSPEIASMASRSVGSAMVTGTAVDTGLYAGAGRARATMTGGSYSGPGTLTVTGSARTSSGAVTTNRNFTATISANGTVDLVPANAGDLLISVSAITIPAQMTAGTVTVLCAVPAGRSATPS